MGGVRVAVINAASFLKDSQVRAAVPALQTQVSRDFGPVWGTEADLTFVKKGARPPQGYWWLTILDDSKQAGTLGYHDVTNEGLPIGKVYARTTLMNGGQWTTTASHELLEMLADPAINLAAFILPRAHSGKMYSYEVCDACEGDAYGYFIDVTKVSNFVYPAWFEPFRERGTQFDHGGFIKKPLHLLPGGYIWRFDMSKGSWHELDAEEKMYEVGESPPRVSSRRDRRIKPRSQWKKSTARFEGAVSLR